MILDVCRVQPVGFCGYPALKYRSKSGGIKYLVDVNLGDPKLLECDASGLNQRGEFVGFNIKGFWHTFSEEPEAPIKRDVVFNLVDKI